MKRIIVVGGSGFVGSHLSARLCKDYEVVICSRNPQRKPPVRGSANVKTRSVDVFDVEDMARLCQGAHAVINLVGILNEKGHDGSGFERAHVETTQAIIDACRKAGVRRFIQMSALGVDKGISHYARTKRSAETAVKQSSLDWTIFRPSVIFGAGDSFLSRFALLVRLAVPVFPLPGASARMQPVYVGDVVEAFARAVEDKASVGQTYELGGPKVYTLKEIVEFLVRTLGIRRWIVGMPDGLARLQAMVLEYVPGKPFSLDNFRSLQTDNVVREENGLERLGISPRSMEVEAPRYLAGASRQRAYTGYRSRAGR